MNFNPRHRYFVYSRVKPWFYKKLQLKPGAQNEWDFENYSIKRDAIAEANRRSDICDVLVIDIITGDTIYRSPNE